MGEFSINQSLSSCCCRTGGIKREFSFCYFQRNNPQIHRRFFFSTSRFLFQLILPAADGAGEKVDNALKKTTMVVSGPARAVENKNPLACTLQAGHGDVAFAAAVVHLIRMIKYSKKTVHALKRSFGFLSLFFFFLSPISSSNAFLFPTLFLFFFPYFFLSVSFINGACVCARASARNEWRALLDYC